MYSDPISFIIAMFLAAFILLLLPSISMPVTKTIYLMSLNFISSGLLGTVQANGKIEFGVWGYCVFPINAVAFGNSFGLTTAECSSAKLGYTFDDELIKLTGLKQAANLISKATSAGLVLHPISCALAFVALVTSIISVKRPSKALIITATIAGYLGALLATIAFIFDCVLYGVARHELTIVSIRWGNAISLAIVGAIAMWLGALGLTSRSRMASRRSEFMGDQEKTTYTHPNEPVPPYSPENQTSRR